eukprot:m.24996 g.24996  ORF g.24996 m.24996 type:complete len:480 (+) comp8812_c0_seq2:740-2179(+)
MSESRRAVEALAAGEPTYGISTGFGALATQHIATERRNQLQRSLVRSHAAGTGALVESEVVRGMMLLRLATMATGRTGVRASTAEAYAAILNAQLTPAVHEYGSLGCSGDLAPLSACALALMGEGDVVLRDGSVVATAAAMETHRLKPVVLEAKEGLALINGTDGMLAMLAMGLSDLKMLVQSAETAAALSHEALLGTDRVFAADLQALRPHPGQGAAAANLRALLAESEIVAAHRGGMAKTRVQDAYSMRCMPSVVGAVRDTINHAETVCNRELASAIDNPVVLPDGRVESNGNFHGAPLGYVLDFLAIAVADLASIAERRTDRLLDSKRSHGLPPFLAADPGVDSGLMIAQYTSAGIVHELKRLAAPASVDSIPTSAMQEDHVSMGWAAARKLRRSLDGLGRVIAIETLAACRGIDMRAPEKPGRGTAAAHAAVRACGAPGPGPDRHLAPEMEHVRLLVVSGGLVRAVEEALGQPLL